MKTFAVHTLGCKVNQYESQQLRQSLEALGLTAVGCDVQPDVVVVNTCCVTHIASSKSRQNIRKVQKTHPKSAIIVTGCLPIGQGNEAIKATNHSKPLNLSQIKDKNPKLTPSVTLKRSKDAQDSSKSLPVLTQFEGQSRAFLKVQDGCDAYCTYCIIPKIRTNVCNKDVKTAHGRMFVTRM
jgi:threonylcarbamoyladenosine tRNA methylthiotransferase MtaB